MDAVLVDGKSNSWERVLVKVSLMHAPLNHERGFEQPDMPLILASDRSAAFDDDPGLLVLCSKCFDAHAGSLVMVLACCPLPGRIDDTDDESERLLAPTIECNRLKPPDEVKPIAWRIRCVADSAGSAFCTATAAAAGTKMRQSDIFKDVRAVHRAMPGARASTAAAGKSLDVIRRSPSSGREASSSAKVALRDV